MGGYDQGLILARTVGAPGFQYVSVSRPGYLGTSIAAGRTPAEQADLYPDILDAFGIGTAAVMAVSGGGPSALQFALRHRDRCWGLVMVSACSARLDVPLPLAWNLMKMTARLSALVAVMRGRVERDPERAARRSIPDHVMRARTFQDPEAGSLLIALQVSTLDRIALRIPGTENDIVQTRENMSFPLEIIDVPVLIVHGTADRVVPFVQNGQSLAARVPGSELLAIDGGEHVSIFTHRAEAKARVSRFLFSHAPAIPLA